MFDVSRYSADFTERGLVCPNDRSDNCKRVNYLVRFGEADALWGRVNFRGKLSGVLDKRRLVLGGGVCTYPLGNEV